MNINGAPFDSPMFKSHVRNVFVVIGDAVDHIDDLGSLNPILKELGAKHREYGAKTQHLEVSKTCTYTSLAVSKPHTWFKEYIVIIFNALSCIGIFKLF
jgi:hemoglobin-like flavoprotein